MADLDELPVALVQCWERIGLDGVHQGLVVGEDYRVPTLDLRSEVSTGLLDRIEFQFEW